MFRRSPQGGALGGGGMGRANQKKGIMLISIAIITSITIIREGWGGRIKNNSITIISIIATTSITIIIIIVNIYYYQYF